MGKVIFFQQMSGRFALKIGISVSAHVSDDHVLFRYALNGLAKYTVCLIF